jgi:hypothetical protein
VGPRDRDPAMREAWSRWVSFLGAQEDAIALALARIVLCVPLAAHIARFLLSGAAEVALTPDVHGGLSAEVGWLEPWGGGSPTSIWILGTVTCVSAILSALGLFTRPALIVTWLSFRALSSLNAEAKGSYDALYIDILFVLALSQCGRALSLDARFFGRGGTAARWPRFMLLFQIGLLYFGSAIVKASSGWVPGGDASALWYILHQPTWARFPSLPLWAYPITQVATTMAWLFELTAPTIVLAALLRESSPRGRVLSALKRVLDRARVLEVYLLFGLMMHLGIEVSMEVGPFCFATIALYPAAIAPDRLRAFFTRPAPATRSSS